MASLIHVSILVATLHLSIAATLNRTFDYNSLSLREVGARNTLEWRMWLEKNGDPISFWHDVPLWPDEREKQIINVVVEIPRWEDGKIEIKRTEPLNPIFHNDRNGAVRFVESVWPHKSYPFLYGSIPQTWESPNEPHNFTGFPGDNDPIDFFDIGQDIGYTGQIKQVKILGGLAPNDGGETDWKLLVIDIRDPLARLVDCADKSAWEDVDKYRPGTTKAFRDWFTYYKVARGDGVIPIIGDSYQGVEFITEVLERGHRYWQGLINGDVNTGKINYNQTSSPKASISFVSKCETAQKFDIPAENRTAPKAKKPDMYDQWYYLDKDFALINVPGSV
ncbi:Inorganic pyrophosphatase 1 [Colletotrichum truncatum]|uniref:Inorganic pyrophosphatase 1 n=1 Tax=Colletotrichum truncatum TaxID=5467 RepID=A0ACC3Z2E3_COLTU